jgi:hypothetical protein
LEEKLKSTIPKAMWFLLRNGVQAHQVKEQIDTVCYYNFMTTRQLEQTFNRNDIVYMSVWIHHYYGFSEAKAFFIPTPGQYEQMYLAKN